MKRQKILPGAAGIIALTATIGFVDGQREIEYESFSRGKITLVDSVRHIATEADLPGKLTEISTDHPTYLVEIMRGDTFAKVLIDAVTGRILVS
jgi:uncharacterized membrane protein YkoI